MPASHERETLLRYLESIDPATLKIRYCEHFDEKSNIWNFRRHQHDAIELIYFLRGRADIASCEDTLRLSVFELVVYPRGVPHQEFLDASVGQEIICLQLDCDAAVDYPRSFKLSDPDGDIKWTLLKIDSEHHARGPYSDTLLAAALQMLMTLMKQQVALQRLHRPAILDLALQFIQEHFAGPLSLARIAGAAYVTPSYLTRQFKKAYGIAPMHYVTLYRVAAARRLLVYTDRPVKDIAGAVGYSDPKHFTRSFHAVTGVTPTSYRSNPGLADARTLPAE